MKRLIAAAIVVSSLLVVLILWSATVRIRHRGSSAPAVSAQTQFDAFASARPRVVRQLSKQFIESQVQSPMNQEVLCNTIGVEGDGLDEPSLVNTEIALYNQAHVSDACLESIIERLEHQLSRREMEALPKGDPLDVALSPSPSNDLGVSLLRKFPDATARVVRKKYDLGTPNPDIRAIPILTNLRLETTCPDITATIAAIRQAKTSFDWLFVDAYKKVCK